MKTERNKIEAKIRSSDKEMADEIDAVYEICDAEFPSEKHLYEAGVRAIAKNQYSAKVISALTDLFTPEVKRVATRDGLMAGVPDDNFRAIAQQLAKDWDSTYGQDYRNETLTTASP